MAFKKWNREDARSNHVEWHLRRAWGRLLGPTKSLEN